MSGFFKVYERLLKTYPILTSSVQTGFLMAIGDVTAQTIVEKKPLKNINWFRTAQFSSVGLFCAGPVLTTWYTFLAKQFGTGGNKTVVLKKVAMDQLLFAPSFLFLFLVLVGVTKGNDLNNTMEEVKVTYFDILMNNYKLWPWVQLGNFYVVPLRYQILVVQSVAILWNTYLSWKTQSTNLKKKLN